MKTKIYDRNKLPSWVAKDAGEFDGFKNIKIESRENAS